MFNGDLTVSAPKLMPGRLRAATLVRVSTAEQAVEGRSGLDRQRKSNAAVVAAKLYQVVLAIELIDVSGTASFTSPELKQLVAMVEAGLIDVVVVSEMSRIIRPDDLSSFASLDVFKRHGVLLDCGGTVHNLQSPEGFLAGGLMALLGGHERMAMLKKMMQSKEASRANGFFPSAPHTLPLGLHYDRAVNRFHYGPEIWKVQEAFRLIDEEGLRNLSEVGRRIGVPPRTLKNLLSNKSYIGIREYTEMRDQSRKITKADGRQGDRPKIRRSPENIISVRVITPEEQAVSDERFERVQKFLEEMADRHARDIAPHKGCNLLTSNGFCGCCGQRLYTATSSKRESDGRKPRGHYLCKSRHPTFKGKLPLCSQGWMRKDRLDELVTAFASRFLEDREFVAAVLANARLKQRASIVPMASGDVPLRRQLVELERRDRRLLDAIEAGAMSLTEAKQRRKRLDEEKQGLLAMLEREQPDTVEATLPDGLIGRIVSLGGKEFSSLTDPREKKAIIAALFLEVYVRGESITAFRLAPSLVGSDSGDWAWVADVPVTLPEPFRIRPEPFNETVPEGHRKCTRCMRILPVTGFYGNRAPCKDCEKAANNARHRAKVAAKHGVTNQ